MKRWQRYALAIFAVFSVGVFAFASQNTLQMPTSGIYSGLQFSNLVTNALDSLVTCNSGSSAPTNPSGSAPKLGQCWIDTTSATLPIKKRYTGSGWVVEGTLDVSNGRWMPPIGGGSSSLTAASTTDLCSIAHSFITINGTTTITSFGSSCQVGVEKTLTFAAAAPVTYDATNMILPGATSRTPAVGDTWRAAYLGSGAWRVINIANIDGSPVSAVTAGSVMDFAGLSAPTGWLLCGGQAVSRTTYSVLFAAITISGNGTRTSASPTITALADTSNMRVGMPVSGTGIPSSTKIRSVDSGTQITLSANATSSGTSTVVVAPFGVGDGSTTFNLPDFRGRMAIGPDDMAGGGAANVSQITSTLTTSNGSATATVGSATGLYIGMYVVTANVPLGVTISAISGTTLTLSTGTGVTAGTTIAARFTPIANDAYASGSLGGAQSFTQVIAQMPAHNHSYNVAVVNSNGTNGGSTDVQSITGSTTGSTGGGQPSGILNPVQVINKIIKIKFEQTAPAANDNDAEIERQLTAPRQWAA